MRVPLKKLLETLGVDRVLSPYETHPWFIHDAARKLGCSAEVRMGPGLEDLEAEIQFLYDETDEDEDTGSAGKAGGAGGPVYKGPQQIMRMRAEPTGMNEWGPKQLWVKKEDYTSKLGGWEQKGCDFFRACIAAIQMGEIPDVEMLIEKELDDDGMGGGRRGRVGRKAPKVNQAALLGMKKGM